MNGKDSNSGFVLDCIVVRFFQVWKDVAGTNPANPKDTTYYMVRTLNNDHLPVQSDVRILYFPQYPIWDTSVHTVTYNADNNPVLVQRTYNLGGISEHRYGYETYKRSYS